MTEPAAAHTHTVGTYPWGGVLPGILLLARHREACQDAEV